MGKQQKNAAGFTIVEVLLTLIVLILLAGTGYFIYHTQKTNKTTTTSSIQKTTTSSQTPVPAADQAVIEADLTGWKVLPADFELYIAPQLIKTEATCQQVNAQQDQTGANANSAGGQVLGAVRDEFVGLNQQESDCEGGAAIYYAKVNGSWTQAIINTEDFPSCTTVNQYKYTKVLITHCYDASNDLIANANL